MLGPRSPRRRRSEPRRASWGPSPGGGSTRSPARSGKKIAASKPPKRWMRSESARLSSRVPPTPQAWSFPRAMESAGRHGSPGPAEIRDRRGKRQARRRRPVGEPGVHARGVGLEECACSRAPGAPPPPRRGARSRAPAPRRRPRERDLALHLRQAPLRGAAQPDELGRPVLGVRRSRGRSRRRARSPRARGALPPGRGGSRGAPRRPATARRPLSTGCAVCTSRRRARSRDQDDARPPRRPARADPSRAGVRGAGASRSLSPRLPPGQALASIVVRPAGAP